MRKRSGILAVKVYKVGALVGILVVVEVSVRRVGGRSEIGVMTVMMIEKNLNLINKPGKVDLT